MSHGQILLCGIEDSRNIKGLADGLGLETRHVASLAQLKLEGINGVSCGLVSYADPTAQELYHELRLSGELVDLPFLAVIEDPWSMDVREAYAAGVEDYIPSFALSQARNKLMALRGDGAPAGTYLSGTVVLADDDRVRRVNLARHLKRMGFEVSFAVDEQIPAGPEIKLVVAHAGLPPAGATACLARYREGPGKLVPWIITGSPEEVHALRAAPEMENVACCDLGTDPAQVVFTANKLLIGAGRAQRRSERIPYETPIHVRIPQSEVEIWGYTYNINMGGLYIRTLTPPALGTRMELELKPPYGRGRVKVDAKVVWRQEYGPGKGYPAGCGVQYDEEALPVADRAALAAGYNALAAEQGGQTGG